MDDLDLQQVSAMFLEECRENVDILERGLLNLNDAEDQLDLLNEVFRAAHSIKGGGATFGFMELSELTHFMETLLDEMRSGSRAVVDADVELLLRGVDTVRELMESDAPDQHEGRYEIQQLLEAAVADDAPASGPAADSSVGAVPGGVNVWRIHFVPKANLMMRGNDPLLLINELAHIGDLNLQVDVDALPEWGDLDPQECYFEWTATLTGDVKQEAIEEIFEWVEFDCDLSISRVDTAPDAEQTPADNSASDTPVESPLVAVAETEATPAPPTDQPAQPKKPDAKPSAAANAESASIRIATDKIDQMINLVGELVITQSMLSRFGTGDSPLEVDELRDRLAELERNTRELQENVMRVRMLPMSSGFSRLPRLVRDLSRKLDKQIDLVIDGAATEIDKTVLERLIDPLVHLVRNALDHGLEQADERVAAGKSPIGTLRLNAFHEGGSVIIEISDDGRGIDRTRILNKAIERGAVKPDDTLTDEQIFQLIFAPGLSTAEQVSDVSGRGVGMDVVRRNILDLGGHIEIDSKEGVGTRIKIRLPLTLAILDGQLICAAGQTFVLPLLSIIETIEIGSSHAATLPGAGQVCRFRGEYVPLINLAKRLRLPAESRGELVVIIELHGRICGVVIDDVLGQQQVVIKALEDNYRTVPGIAGATIMSDGSVALILDPPSLTAPDRQAAVA